MHQLPDAHRHRRAAVERAGTHCGLGAGAAQYLRGGSVQAGSGRQRSNGQQREDEGSTQDPSGPVHTYSYLPSPPGAPSSDDRMSLAIVAGPPDTVKRSGGLLRPRFRPLRAAVELPAHPYYGQAKMLADGGGGSLGIALLDGTQDPFMLLDPSSALSRDLPEHALDQVAEGSDQADEDVILRGV